MRTRTSCAVIVVALTLAMPLGSSAQVVEDRESDANPAAAIFRSTLFGAGTGLALGGAYALIDQGEPSTGDILRWGVAGGAAAGVVIGIIYVATRSEAEGSAEAVGTDDVGLLRMTRGELDLSLPSLQAARRSDAGGRSLRAVEAKLLEIQF